LTVLSGLNFNALRMQLETLLLNPGIQPDLVTVRVFSCSTCLHLCTCDEKN